MGTATIQTRKRTGIARILLITVECLVIVGAVFGGIGLLTDSIGMDADWLAGTPFGSWVVPGVLLLVIVAAPMTAAAVTELRHHPLAYAAALTAGAALVGWIIAQWLIFGKFFYLQPTMFAAGLLVLLLAWLTHRGEPIRPPRR